MQRPALKYTLPLPADYHVHLRDGEMLRYTVPLTARVFGRALIMPNLQPPVSTVAAALAYRKRILRVLEGRVAYQRFEPLMALYLQETTTATDVAAAAAKHPVICGYKYYPRGVTTNAQHGIRSITAINPALAAMERLGVPLMIHGESPDATVDVFDREAHFIETVLSPLLRRFPALKVTLEHISTKTAVDFIAAAAPHVKATITLHHLMLTRTELLGDVIRPHYYCKPIVKRVRDRAALQDAAFGKLNARQQFFFGSDSAPHAHHLKESSSGCAGIFTAPFLMEQLCELFLSQSSESSESSATLEQRINALSAFASTTGTAHYKLLPIPFKLSLYPTNTSTEKIPARYTFGNCGQFIPFIAEKSLKWHCEQIFEPEKPDSCVY